LPIKPPLILVILKQIIKMIWWWEDYSLLVMEVPYLLRLILFIRIMLAKSEKALLSRQILSSVNLIC
jgi:hypothetical protein